MNLTSDQLIGFAGVLLSLAFTYVPGLSTLYDKQTSQIKAAIMLVALVIVTGAVYGLSCVNWLNLATCDQAGLKQLLTLFFIALIGNQATYLATRRL